MVLVADVPLDTPEELAAKRFTYARAPSLGAPNDLSDRPSNATLQYPELPQKRTHSSIAAPEQHQQATPHVPLFSRRQHQLSEMTKASRNIDNESRAAKMNFVDLVPGTSPTAASFVSGPLDAPVTHSDAQLVEEGNDDSSAVKLFKRPRKEGTNDKPTHAKKRTYSKNSTAPVTTTADDIQPIQSIILPQIDQDAAQCIALVKSTVATRKESEIKLQQREIVIKKLELKLEEASKEKETIKSNARKIVANAQMVMNEAKQYELAWNALRERYEATRGFLKEQLEQARKEREETIACFQNRDSVDRFFNEDLPTLRGKIQEATLVRMELEGAKQAIEELKAVKEQALFDRAGVQEELKHARQQHVAQLEKANKETNELRESLCSNKDLKADIAKVESINEVQQCKIESLGATLKERETRISDLVKTSANAIEQRDRVQEMLNEKAITIESIYKEKEELCQEVNKLESEIDGIRECLEIANEEKKSLQLQLSEMETIQTEMNEEMLKLDAEKQKIERRERTVSNGLDNTTQLIDELNAKAQDQSEKLNKALAIIEQREASIKDAQNEAKIAQIAVQEAQAAQKVAEEALKTAEEAKEAAEKVQEAAKDTLPARKTAEAAEAGEVTQKAAQVADQLVEPEAQEKEAEEEDVVQKAPEAPMSVQKVIRQYGHQSRAAPSGRKTRFPRMGNSTLGHVDEESQASAASYHTATSSLPLGPMQPSSSLQRSNSMRRSRSQWFSMHNNSTQSQKRDEDDDNDSMKGSESISSSLSSEVATNDGE